MSFMPDWLSAFFPQYAYLAFFLFSLVYSFCLPICEEIALLGIGLLAKLYDLDIFLAIASCYPGFVLSDYLYYTIARLAGARLVRSRLLRKVFQPDKIMASEVYFERHGSKIVFICRFLVGVRAPCLIAAGMFRMPFLTFSLYDSLSAVVSVGIWFPLGYFWGSALGKESGPLSVVLSILAPICIGLAFYFILRNIRAEQKNILEEIDRRKTPIDLPQGVLHSGSKGECPEEKKVVSS